MSERRPRRTADERRIPWEHRERVFFDRATTPINAINPIFLTDPRLPLLLYLERGFYDSAQSRPLPDMPA